MRPVRLQPAQDERPGEPAQLLGRLLVAEPLDRDREALPERRRRPEQRRVEHLHDRPQLPEVVLDGGAGQREPAGRGQRPDRFGLLGLGVLHVLGLVEHDPRHGHLPARPVPVDERVAGDHDVRGRAPVLEGASRARVAPWCISTVSSGAKRSDSRPVADDRGRADDEGGPGCRALLPVPPVAMLVPGAPAPWPSCRGPCRRPGRHRGRCVRAAASRPRRAAGRGAARRRTPPVSPARRCGASSSPRRSDPSNPSASTPTMGTQAAVSL